MDMTKLEKLYSVLLDCHPGKPTNVALSRKKVKLNVINRPKTLISSRCVPLTSMGRHARPYSAA